MTYSVQNINIEEDLTFVGMPGLTQGYVLSVNSDGTTYWGPATETVADTGVEISFTEPTIYNTSSSPATGNITDNLTNAKLGIVQKIYHNHSTSPTFPAGWKLMGSNTYLESSLNTIFCEWVGGTRVEYWVVQEN